MNKGFVFTIDTIFAIIVAITLAGTMVSLQETEKGKEKMFETTAQTARDKAMIENYMPTGTSDTTPAGSEYYYTMNTIEYNLPNETVLPRGPIDVALAADVSESMDDTDIYYYTTPETTVSGGTCNGGTDCSNHGDCDQPDYSTAQLLGTITIDASTPMAKIRKDVSTFEGYAGNCDAPQIFLKSPAGTYYPLSFSDTGKCHEYLSPENSFPGDCCFATSTGECTNLQSHRPWPNLQNGNWEIYGWSDKPVEFSSIDFYISRMDAVKKAAMAFLDNPGWKANDTFSLVGGSNHVDWIDDFGAGSPYSETIDHYTSVLCGTTYPETCPEGEGNCRISSCLPLTADKASIKAEIEKMTPIHSNADAEELDFASELVNLGANKKYLVFLTDGKLPEETIVQFKQAAENARSNGITVYTIGFAGEAIQVDAMEQAAKDKDSAYCNDGLLCGRYFFAETGNELNNVYTQIASELARGEIGGQGAIVTIKKTG